MQYFCVGLHLLARIRSSTDECWEDALAEAMNGTGETDATSCAVLFLTRRPHSPSRRGRRCAHRCDGAAHRSPTLAALGHWRSGDACGR